MRLTYESIRARRTSVKKLSGYAGIYRIWNFGFKKGTIIQSKFIIDEKGRAYLYPFFRKEKLREQYGKQPCLYSISLVRPNKVCVASHSSPAMSVVNYAIFDYEREAIDGFIEGAYISIGHDPRGLTGGFMIIKRETEENFEPQELRGLDRVKLEKQENLSKFRRALFELWREKLWKSNK